MNIVEMTFNDWLDKFKPINNHLDDNASFQDEDGVGVMFETYGEEVEFVKSQDILTIWTYVDEDDESVVLDGFKLCNRIGYFITEVPREEDTRYVIDLGY